MPGPVERWLETFMCKQYANLFENYGYKTLQQVCQLQRSTLHSMGITPDHCDKIIENVSVLRQSLVASSPEHMGSHDTNFPPPSSYGGRHNPQNHPYSGSGCNYPENAYDNQMSSHAQYGYHPPAPSSYSPAPNSGQQQYNGGRILHPYSNNQSYSGSQGTQYTPTELYGQYGNRMGQANWDSNAMSSHEAMHAPNAYNQSPRHHTMGSPPPHPVLRSPPPTAGMSAMAHYRQMMLTNMADQPPAQHPHATWSQSQIASPGMMHSPRTTPSPGMGHAPSNLSNSSPLLNRSPAHKPFSPPPFSPHGPPPPAHQHVMSNYENPQTTAPPPSTPSPSSRPVTTTANSDPLQSLQKMVMSESTPPPPQVRNSPNVPTPTTTCTTTTAPPPPPPTTTEGARPNFSSIEQLVGKEQKPPQSVESTLSSVSSPASSCPDHKSNHVDVTTEENNVQKCNGVRSAASTPTPADDEKSEKVTTTSANKCNNAKKNGETVTPTLDQSPRGRWKQSVVNSVINSDKGASKEQIKTEQNGPAQETTPGSGGGVKRTADTSCIVSCPPKKKSTMCFRQMEESSCNDNCRTPEFSVVANPAQMQQNTVDLSHLKSRLIVAPPPSSMYSQTLTPKSENHTDEKQIHRWSMSSSSQSSAAGDSPLKKKRGRPLGSKNKPKSEQVEAPPKKMYNKKKGKVTAAPPVQAAPLDENESDNNVKVVEKKNKIVEPKVVQGPYVHVEGTKDHPVSVTVVNVSNHKDDDSDGRGGRRKTRTFAKEASANSVAPPTLSHFTKRKLAKIGYSCTLSAKYDAVTKDKTWVCALCRKGSHDKGLGDLFGPYFENKKNDESCSPPERQIVVKVRCCRRTKAKLKEEYFQSKTSKKGKRTREAESSSNELPTAGAAGCGSNSLPLPTSPSSSSETLTRGSPNEIWVHENCIVWSHGVYSVGNKVFGLEEAVRVASDMICCKCKESGATLGCLNKGCTEQYHYSCALEKGCHLDEENFSLVCFKHKRKPRQGST